MTENITKKTGKVIQTKTIRMPIDLIEKIEKDAKEHERDFTKQVIYIIKKYYNFVDQ